MLSVLIETHDSEAALARTLASLVGGAVEGVVREVIVCDRGSVDHTSKVAEHAGCHYLPDAAVGAGIGAARSDWLLFLEPGARLLDGWTEAVASHAAITTAPARFTRARQTRQSFFSRLVFRRNPLAEGLVMTRDQALSLADGHGSASALASAVATRRLSAEIIVASVFEKA